MPEERFVSKEELQLVVFKVGNEEFGVNIAQVREILRLMDITRMPKAPPFIEGVLNLRGQVIAVMDLAKRFGLPSTERDEKTTRIVVVEVEDNMVGMVVDEVIEVLRLPAENVEPTPALIETEIHERYLKGVGKLKDRLLVLIDLGAILSAEELEHVKKVSIEKEADELEKKKE